MDEKIGHTQRMIKLYKLYFNGKNFEDLNKRQLLALYKMTEVRTWNHPDYE